MLARTLRNAPTKAEHRLWQALRKRQVAGARFRRQHRLGPYIADFVCLELRLVIEVDGGQHAQNPRDRVRDAWMEGQGYTVLRVWNNEVLQNLEGVVAVIEAEVRRRAWSAE
jgi:very-short-patch-repair endonuclease